MRKEQKNITIIGTGAYGTVLANVLTDNDHNVIMYGIDSKEVNDINDEHLNSHFGDLKLIGKLKQQLILPKLLKTLNILFWEFQLLLLNQLLKELIKQ